MVIENLSIYQFYRDRLETLALSQFEWHNLPDTCDPWYFERQLLYKGACTFFKPKDVNDIYSLSYLQKSGFNGYGYPAGITPIDFNGRRYDTDDYEILFDNVKRSCLLPWIDLYAKKLYEIDCTIRNNLMQQNTPYVVPATKNTANSFREFFRKVFAFSPVLMLKNTDCANIQNMKALDLNVEFKGNAMNELKESVWAEALHILGIAPSKVKKERMITSELVMDRQEDIVSIQSRLLQRARFCDKINKRWGLDVSVNLTLTEDDVKDLTNPFGMENGEGVFGYRSRETTYTDNKGDTDDG